MRDIKREQTAIKEKLIESCKFCWKQYGYKKTSVSELASMSGISTGAFYSHFPSKEMLFIETHNAFMEKLYGILTENIPANPTKRDLSDRFKRCVNEGFENKWVFLLRDDYEAFLRKLPEDLWKQDYEKDLMNITRVITVYGLVPKVSMDEISAVLNTLFMSIDIPDVIGVWHRRALELMIDSTMECLFEGSVKQDMKKHSQA